MGTSAKAAAVIGILALLIYTGHVVLASGVHLGLHLKAVLVEVLRFVKLLGWSGKPVLGLILVLTIVFCLPSTPLNVGAGFLYGWSYLPVLVAAGVGGACLSFLIGRTVLAPIARSHLEKHELFEALNELFERDSEEFSWRSLQLVLLLRASPVFPFPVINYSCGISKLGFSTYATGTAIGMVPWLAVDVYFGTVLTDVAEVGHPRSVEYVVGIAAFTVVVTAFITVRARRFLDRHRRKKNDVGPGRPAVLTPQSYPNGGIHDFSDDDGTGMLISLRV
mmetsp:Transcript_3727/g.11697  ORF Transcript_3727/g.11697 Transcript_3727/m.11697 type:complete len:278 (+) Transcript_3727:164-997(+)